jgi:hypothetical protein
MAVDGKYGHVTLERGDVGEDEPVVVFRAQDAILPDVLRYYRLRCAEQGSPQHHLNLLEETIRRVRGWQEGHPTKVPTSDSLALPDSNEVR